MNSHLHDSIGSINMNQADVTMANYSSGMQLNGRMSAVRRFFCLFVTFDVLFIALFWIICVMIDGKEILDGLNDEIVHYDIKSSMFDVVICGAVRFLALILFYAIIHINHWWLVAITTAVSCACLIGKSLLYHWTGQTSYPFRVMLVLMSFLISWAEAWFVDFRILPQEERGRCILESIAGDRASEEGDRRYHMIRQLRDCLSHNTESVGNFYSPLESPADSGDEDVGDFNNKLSPHELYVKRLGRQALASSLESLNVGNWELEKKLASQAVIYSKTSTDGYKVFKLTGTLDAPAQIVFNDTVLGFSTMPLWNSGISECKIIKMLDENMDITYQVAQDRSKGVIKTRDFVNVRTWKQTDTYKIIASVSVTHPDVPVNNGYVRGKNGPSCLVFYPVEENRKKCKISWLLDVKLTGWTPKYIFDKVMIQVMSDFIDALQCRVIQLSQCI